MISTLVADPEPHRRQTRLSRPPQFDPPYDDERHLSIPSPRRSEPAPPPPPAIRAKPAQQGPTSARAALAYVRLCLEVLNGFRPATHLRHLSGPVEFVTVIDQLQRRRNSPGHFGPATAPAALRAHNVAADRATGATVGHAARAGGGTLGTALPNGGRTFAAAAERRGATNVVARHAHNAVPVYGRTPARPNAAAQHAQMSLTRLRVSEPLDGIAEAVAVLSFGGRSCGLALRLERSTDSWICSVAQVV
jgi:hypothetical protein